MAFRRTPVGLDMMPGLTPCERKVGQEFSARREEQVDFCVADARPLQYGPHRWVSLYRHDEFWRSADFVQPRDVIGRAPPASWLCELGAPLPGTSNFAGANPLLAPLACILRSWAAWAPRLRASFLAAPCCS